MAKTKILVIQTKELIYTAIFAGLGILLILLLVIMFLPSKDKTKETSAAGQSKYTPGVYNSQITLGDSSLNLEVVVDANQIKSVSFINLEETVTTMYPLVKPALEDIEKQLMQGTDISQITTTEKSKYTQTLLLEGIKTALEKAVTNSI